MNTSEWMHKQSNVIIRTYNSLKKKNSSLVGMGDTAPYRKAFPEGDFIKTDRYKKNLQRSAILYIFVTETCNGYLGLVKEIISF